MRIIVFCLALALSPITLAIPETTVSHHPGEFIQAIQDDPAAGEKIYKEFCASCHAPHPSINVGAPRLQNQSDWQKYSSLNLAGLLKMADTGGLRMPPRGGCFECSDENLKAAILYMLPPQK